MRSIPKEERPREKLMREGVEALSLSELLAIILATGTRGKSALALAQELIYHFKDLHGLLDASIEELIQIKGMGRVKAIKLRAVFGIALRNNRSSLVLNMLLTSAQQAFEIIKGVIAHEKKEILFILLRDIRGRLIHSEKVAVGTLSEVLVHPREVFYIAVRHKAHSLIVAHNHPSGDHTPSKADLDLTTILLHSSRVMGIELDDHLIVTPSYYTSFREQGFLGKEKVY